MTPRTLRAVVERALVRAFVVWLGCAVAAVVLSWLPVNMRFV